MRLIICGNGFDIHHGLLTKYEDYKQFLEGKKSSTMNYSFLVNNFVKNNYLNTPESDRWTDIEKSLTIRYEDYIKDYISVFHPHNRVKADCPTYQKDIAELFNRKVQFTDGFIKDITDFTGILFYDWLSNIETLNVKRALSLSSNDLYITFNYLNTLETLYDIPKENILYIHGALSNVEISDLKKPYKIRDSIVLELRPGFLRQELQFGSIDNNPKLVKEELVNKYKDDELYEEFYKKMIDDLINYLEWSYKDIEKNIDKILEHLSNKVIDEVAIMGHSLLGVDDYYYEKIFVPIYRSSRWKHYIYNENDKIMGMEFEKKYAIHLEPIEWL